MPIIAPIMQRTDTQNLPGHKDSSRLSVKFDRSVYIQLIQLARKKGLGSVSELIRFLVAKELEKE